MNRSIHRSDFRLLLTLLLALVALAAASSAAGVDEETPRFGIVEALWSPEQAAALGVGWERILFYWSEIQPEGPESWNTLHVMEEWLDAANAADRDVVGLISHTPAWATDGAIFGGVPRGLELPVDDPGNLWAAFLRRLTTYYAERGVHRWIIWNEPDIDPTVYGNEWEGSVADYYRLLKVAYLVIKEVDPEATIHLAGLTYWHDRVANRQQYLERLLEVATSDPEAAANGYFFDVISLHIYFRVETIPSIVEEIDAIQRSFGLQKPIWINETNAAPTMDPEWPVERPQFPVDLEQQAWFIIQAHALGFAAGVESIGVYKLSDVLLPPGAEAFGLLRADLSERPAFAAHQTAVRYFRGFQTVSQQRTDDYYLVTVERPGGVARVLWTRVPSALTISLPATASEGLLVNALGESRSLVPEGGKYRLSLDGARCHEECIIGGPPLLLVEAFQAPTPPVTVTAGPTTAVIVQPNTTALATPELLRASTATPPARETPVQGAQQSSGSQFLGLWALGGAAGVALLLLLLVKFGRRS